MTLAQLQELKVWHVRQGHRHPVEKALWDLVLTVWMLGWIGAPTSFLLELPWVVLGCIGALFVPGLYIALRRRLHNKRRLRCDWIIALR